MNPAMHGVGIDIGGTKTSIAAVDGRGHISAKAEFATRSERGFGPCIQEIVAHVRDVLSKAGVKKTSVTGVGIGCAGPVNPAEGTIHNPHTLPGWPDGVDIATPIKETIGVPVWLENDADAAALGEFTFGAGSGANPLVIITLGTGVGGSAIVDGGIHRGVQGAHPEFGHIPVLADGPSCYCGLRGCWESIASGTAIAAAGKPFGHQDSPAVFAAAATDENATRIIQSALEATATATWTLLHTFLPERIILGGGIGEQHFDLFAPVMRQRISSATQIPECRPEVIKAKLGRDAGVIGAASLVFHNSKIT